MAKNIELLINRSEITAGTRGASLGPDAIITAARANQSTVFKDFEKVYVEDQNEMLDQQVIFPNAKRAQGLLKVFNDVSDKISSMINEGAFPFVLAADHGSAGG